MANTDPTLYKLPKRIAAMSMNIAINDSNQLVNVKQVERGLACNCICFECNEPVIARKGEKNGHHFAHSSNKESCSINPESILHKFAKQVILESKSIVLPPLPNTNETNARKWHFTHLVEEQSIGSIRPDIVCSLEDETIFIEVAVTSFIEADKLDFLKCLNIKTVEIDLRNLLSQDVEIPSEEAKSYILEQVENKQWVYPEVEKPDFQLNDWLSTLNMPCPNESKITNDKDVQLPKPSKNYIRYRFTIDGIWVDAWEFDDGGVSVKSVSYNLEIIALLRQWKNEGGGRYNTKFKAWKYFNPFAAIVLRRLKEMDTTPKI